ncbi:MAG TPA: hypothetical protein VII76_09720 [Acidimicrobiales bacterium]
MTESLQFLGLVALLLLGAGGWGTVAVGALERAGWDTARQEIGPALQLVLGVSLFLVVGGVLVACDVARFDVLLSWHLVGVVLLLTRSGVGIRRLRSLDVATVLYGLAAGVVGVVLVVLSVGIAIGSPFYNVFDDDAAYVYFAQRLLSTGGLIDPFNARRMTSYGGATLYQSFFLHAFGNTALRGFEFTFAALLLIVVAVGTMKRRWLALGMVVVGFGVLLGHGIGPVQNLSPTLSAAALSLGAYQLLGKVRSSPQADQPWLYVAIGVVLGGILALRFYYLTSVAVAAVIAIVVARGRRSVKPILLVVCVGTVSVSGWAVALYRSSRTPLFPLLEGNYNPSYPVGPNPLSSGVASYARQVWSVVKGDDVGWVALACLAVALSALILRFGDRQVMVVLLAAGVGCLAQMFVFTVIFSGFAAIEIDRFEGPSTLAGGLFALGALWPLREPRASSSHARHLSAPATAAPGASAWRRVAPGALTVVLLLGLASLIFGGTAGVVWRSSTTHIRSGIHVLRGTIGFPDRYTDVETQYAQLDAAIPPGAKVLAAVDYPSLLGFSRYQFATLDLAGSASPLPHMPYFQGAAAKVAYLRHLGYDYIVADSVTAHGLYQFQPWENDLRSPRYNYRAWAPYFIDWMSSITSLERTDASAVRYFGSLALIPIRDR